MSRTGATLQSALSLLQAGDAARAAALLLPLAQREPKNGEVAFACASALLAAGQSDRAAYFFERASQLSAADLQAQLTIAGALVHASLGATGIVVAKRALALAPAHAQARVLLARATKAQAKVPGAYELGLNVLREGLARYPNQAELHQELARWLFAVGEADASLVHARRARELAPPPGDRSLACGLASHINYAEHESPEAILAAHRQAGEAVDAARPTLEALAARRDGGGDGRITVGLVSPNFHRHSVSYFVRAIFEHLDRRAFRLMAYADHRKGSEPDATTAMLRARADGWCDATAMTDEALARRIRDDGVDVLVDLAGHTAGDRLGVFAARAAPMQLTAIGYPNTTGVPAMDLRLVDEITDPPGSEAHATERLLRVPGCFLCFWPDGGDEVPEVVPPPCAREGKGGEGGVTFGSFNTQMKVTPGTIDLWCRVLEEVPGARLVLKNFVLSEAAAAEHVRSKFVARGIRPERLTLLGVRASWREHLESYSLVDVALDTFPYQGTTTTCEALYMGVPVVTRRGDRHASRVGASLLETVGLGDWVAQNEDDYVRIAVRLAQDRAALATFRATLRGKLLASPLCDGPGYAKRLGEVLQRAWDERSVRS